MINARNAINPIAKSETSPSLPAGARHLRQIVAGMSDGVILIGTGQRILWANPYALQMHGVATIADLGAPVSESATSSNCDIAITIRWPWAKCLMEWLLAGEAFDEVVVDVAPAGAAAAHWNLAFEASS